LKVKKIHCLSCNTILEADFDKGQSYIACKCINGTELHNRFTISQPGSLVIAIDKTKVKAQAIYDIKGTSIKKDDWFYLIEPEKDNEPKYTSWTGRYGGSCSGFIEGLVVDFKTDLPMTFNECRTYLKSNMVTGPEGQIFHLISNKED